jgi:hypothetical protein
MSYIGQTLPADTFQGFVTDRFTGDGTANKTFTLSKTPFNESAILVTIDGVVQEATDDFTVSGTTLTLVGTAPNNSEVNAIHIGGALPIGQAASLDLNGASDQLILDADADTTISADTDDQIDFKAGGTDIFQLTATTATINDGTTITTNDNSDTLTLVSTDADANVGPNLNLYRNSSSPADDDVLGLIIYNGQNDNNETIIYARQVSYIKDASDGTEDGQLSFQTMVGGTIRDRLNITPTEIVLNEDSQDLDLRVESDGNANMFVVDASTNKVHVGCNADTADKGILIVEGAGTSGSTACYGLIRSSHEGTIGLSSIGGLTLKSFSSEVIAQDSAGNSTTLSPHNFEMIPDGASEELAWAYYSRRGDEEDYDNTKYVNVDLTKVVRSVENITGEKFIYTGTGDTDDGSTVTENKLKALEDRIKALEDA